MQKNPPQSEIELKTTATNTKVRKNFILIGHYKNLHSYFSVDPLFK